MTREEIIEMLNWHPSHARTHGGSEGLLSRIERVVAVAVAAEREACAKLCEAEAEKWEGDDGPICAEARMCAVNIRARGKE